MKLQIRFRSIILLLLCVSCDKKNPKTESVIPFQNFISKQNIIKLPFHYDLVQQDFENCIKAEIQDSSFVGEHDYIIGLLPDTLDNFKLLYLATGDDFFPCLKIFDKSGKILSDTLICFPECASGDCAFDSCASFVDIKNDFITRTFKATITDCDSLGNKIQGTTQNQIKKEKISIDKSGKLTIRKI